MPCVVYYTVCVTSDNQTRQAVMRYAVNSGRSRTSEPETGRHDNISDAEMRTTCDWPLNVTWIFQHYNVSESQCAIFLFLDQEQQLYRNIIHVKR